MNGRQIGVIGAIVLIAVAGAKFVFDWQSNAQDAATPTPTVSQYSMRPEGQIKLIQSGFSDDVKKEFRNINSITSVFDLSSTSLDGSDTVAIMLSNWDAVDTEAPETLRANIRKQVEQVDAKRQVVFFTISSHQADRSWPVLVFNQSAFEAEGVSAFCRAMIVHDLAYLWDGKQESTASFARSNARACVEKGWVALPAELHVSN